MQTVCADHDIITVLRTALEVHVYTFPVVLNRFDRIVETIMYRAVTRPTVEQVRKCATREFNILVKIIGSQLINRHSPNYFSLGTHKSQVAGSDMRCADLDLQPHPLHHFERSPTDIDCIAAASHSRCSLHHGDVETVAIEPVGKRGASDAGAGYQNPAVSAFRKVTGHQYTSHGS